MDAVIRFLTDYRGPVTEDQHFDRAGDIVDRYNLSTCVLLVEMGVAEWVFPQTEDEPAEETPVTVVEMPKPKRGRKPKAAQ